MRFDLAIVGGGINGCGIARDAVDDIVWRRTKLGLALSPEDISALGVYLDQLRPAEAKVVAA